jgi:hypothetical protein
MTTQIFKADMNVKRFQVQIGESKSSTRMDFQNSGGINRLDLDGVVHQRGSISEEHLI